MDKSSNIDLRDLTIKAEYGQGHYVRSVLDQLPCEEQIHFAHQMETRSKTDSSLFGSNNSRRLFDMPDNTREASAPKGGESYSDALFKDAYNFYTDTVAHPDARLRQAFVATGGAVIGSVKDIPIELRNHPCNTAGKVLANLAVGSAAASLLAVESPWIVAGTLAAGGFLTGVALKNTWDKACNDSELSKALSATWKNGDSATMLNSLQIAEKQLGPEAFDYELAAITGSMIAKSEPSLMGRIANKLGSKTPWHFSRDSVWTTQPDGTKVSFNPWSRSTATQYTDGTTIEIMSNGRTNTYHPNGDFTEEHPNGVKEITRHDGAKEICYPNGKNIYIDRSGRSKTTLPNGTIIYQRPDGDTFVQRVDGSGSRKDVDGSIYTWCANGDRFDINSLGRKTFYNVAEGILYEVLPDGKKVPTSWYSLKE